MPDENLVLQTKCFLDYVRLRQVLGAFPGFSVRSSARGTMTVDPNIPQREILDLFKEYGFVNSYYGRRSERHILRHDDHLIDLSLSVGGVEFETLSKSDNARDVIREILKRLAPHRRHDNDDDGVWVEFSYFTPHGVERTTQFLRTPRWEDIRANYPAPAAAPLQRLFEIEDPWKRGRLIIWHGPPGTGKTYAIRSLMMHWRSRFSFTVINDPERLAQNPAYYYEIASESTEVPRRFRRRYRNPELEDFDAQDDEDEPPKKRRCLFIMEDCADLILKESRGLHSDKIGKLLNITDGLFGQGREDVFLLTFNEDVAEIDPAFLRPGRCIANLGFPKFAPGEAAAWLAAQGAADPRAGDEMTLAEMYERVHRGEAAELKVAGGNGCAKGFGEGRRG